MVWGLMGRRAALAALCAGGLSGCIGDLFKGEGYILPGERISVRQAGGSALTPDAAGAAIALPAATRNADWPQLNGGGDRYGGHVAGPASLALAWRADAGSGSGSRTRVIASPVAAEGRIYALDAASGVAALDADSGGQVWRRDLTPEGENPEDGFGGGLAYDGGRLFVSSGFGLLHALSAQSGETVWSAPLRAPSRAAPAVAAGRVYVVTRDNRLLAFDANSGERLWTEQGLEQSAGMLGGGAPAATADVTVAPYSSGELTAYSAGDGRAGWLDDLTGSGRASGLAVLNDVAGDPVIADGAVFAASQSGRLVSIDLRTGDRNWTRDFGGVNAPYVAGNALFFVTSNGDLVAMLKDTGDIVWTTPLGAYEDPEDREDAIAWHGPVLAGGRLLVAGGHGRMVSVDAANGAIIADVEAPGGAAAAPIVAGGVIYVLTEEADLLAYR